MGGYTVGYTFFLREVALLMWRVLPHANVKQSCGTEWSSVCGTKGMNEGSLSFLISKEKCFQKTFQLGSKTSLCKIS